MGLCEVHEMTGNPDDDDRHCLRCGTPKLAITALVDLGAELDGLVNKFGEDGQAYQGPQFWQDRVDSIGRALADSNNQLADKNRQMVIEKQNHLDTSNWALEQQDRANRSEIALSDAKRWVDVYRMLRNAHKDHRRVLIKRVADLESALHQDEHYCTFDDNGWSIEHLVECRPYMTKCEFHLRMDKTASVHQTTRRGRFIMRLVASDLEFIEVDEK